METPFFLPGGTLPTGAASYIQRRADTELVTALLAGQYCYVLTTRQMGKSSLMVRTAARLREQDIRGCYTTGAADPRYSRLAFCLLGVATPADLIVDTRVSPFNIGVRIELRDFTPEEAAPLAAGFISRSQPASRRQSPLLARVLY